jgi:hypothetical protein
LPWRLAAPCGPRPSRSRPLPLTSRGTTTGTKSPASLRAVQRRRAQRRAARPQPRPVPHGALEPGIRDLPEHLPGPRLSGRSGRFG